MMPFWLLQSQYLIAIEPPLKPGTKIIQCVSGFPCEVPVHVDVPSRGSVKVLSAEGMSPAGFTSIAAVEKAENTQIVTLKAAKGMEIYLYLLVLLISGFSGDKVLKTVTDKVSNKLFAEAEKTKDGK